MFKSKSSRPHVKALSAVALAGSVLVGCGGGNPSNFIDDARKQMAQGDYVAAEIALKSALQRNPADGEARVLLGVTLLEQGQAAAAATELGKARDAGVDVVRVDPLLARALVEAGRAKDVQSRYGKSRLTDRSADADLRAAVALGYAQLGLKDLSQQAMAEALEADPRRAYVLLVKARLDAGAGQIDAALKSVDEAIALGGPQPEAWLLKGVLLRHGKRDLPGAEAAYNKAAAVKAYAFNANLALLNLNLLQSNMAAAKERLATLKKLQPRRAETMLADAEMAYIQREYPRAKEITDQLLRLLPDSRLVLTISGAIDIQLGSLVPAESKLGKAAQMQDVDGISRKLLTEVYIRQGQSDKAIATLRPLFDAGRPDRDILTLAGQAHLIGGRVREAEALFADAVKLSPGDAYARTALAMAEVSRGQVQSGLSSLQSIAASDASGVSDMALISTLVRQRDYPRALDAVAALEKKNPNSNARYLRGVILRSKGDVPGARAAFESQLQQQPAHVDAVLALAGLDLVENKLDAAKARLDAAVKQDPRNIRARMALVDVMARKNESAEAIEAAIVDAIKAGPSEPAPRVALIARRSAANDTRGALAVAQEALAAIPNDPVVLESAGQAQFRAGEFMQAISTYERLSSLLPRSPVPLLALAGIRANRGDKSAYERAVRRAFEVAPESQEVFDFLVRTAGRTRDVKLLLDLGKELQARKSQSPMGHTMEGEAEAIRGDQAAAAKAFRRAAATPSAGPNATIRLYQALMAGKQPAEAEAVVDAWQKAHPGATDLSERLGDMALRRNDLPNAEKRFRAVLAVRPNSVSALNNLAWILAERGQKGAVQFAEKAVALTPGQPPLLDTLAKALASEGQGAKAIEVQKQAVALASEPDAYRLNLARLYVKAGDRDAAMKELDALAALGDRFQLQAGVAALRAQVAKK